MSSKPTTLHAVGLAIALALAGCGRDSSTSGASSNAPAGDAASTSSANAPAAPAAAPTASGVVRVDGSSTVYPITEAVAEEFQIQSGGKTQVTIGVSGTGGGFKKFCRGEIEVANASRPIQKAEMEACAQAGITYFELPIAYDALTVVVNPQNPLSSITVDQLKKIWAPESQGQVLRWNQVDASFPDQELKLYGAGADSGTFDYFTEAVVGKAKSSRGDFTASEDDNVLVQGVSADPGALGYFGYAYYAENQDKLKALAVNGVAPSKETVMSGQYTPLSRPLLVYVAAPAYQRPEVKAFVDFYLTNAATLAEEAKFVPLPANAYTQITANLAAGKLGSVFGGEPATAITIEQLLEREASH